MLALLGAWGLAFSATCADEAPVDAGFASLGRFRVCMHKVADDCERPDAGCAAQVVDDGRAAAYALKDEGGGFYLQREGAPPVEGRASGPRFAATLPALVVDSTCDCPMRVTESIRGELSTEPVGLDCPDDAPDAGTCFPHRAGDAGSDDAFLAGAGGEPLDPERYYSSVRGRIVDVLEPVDGGCSCGPCRIEYEFHGRR